MVFIAKKLLLDREIAGLQFNIFRDQSNTQLNLIYPLTYPYYVQSENEYLEI